MVSLHSSENNAKNHKKYNQGIKKCRYNLMQEKNKQMRSVLHGEEKAKRRSVQF